MKKINSRLRRILIKDISQQISKEIRKTVSKETRQKRNSKTIEHAEMQLVVNCPAIKFFADR